MQAFATIPFLIIGIDYEKELIGRTSLRQNDLYIVKRLLGHASITSTLEYIDESVDNLRDILEAELM